MFSKVTKDHILQAIKDFGDKEFPKEFGPSSTYYLIYEGKMHPTHPIMAYATFHASGKKNENHFSDGKETNCFSALESNGFF